MTVLVTGATGTIGSRLVSDLAASGQDVRAAVRSHQRAQALASPSAAVVADLDDPTAVDRAVAGCDQVVLITANTERQVQQEAHVIAAAARHGVAHLIKLSVGGVAADAPLALARDHFQAEQQLLASGVLATVVRPGFLMQNLLQYAAWIDADGRWQLPLGEAPIAMIDAADVAAGLAALVARGTPGTDEVWTGPEALTTAEAARQLSEVTGRTITYADGDAESFYARYVADGHEPRYARDIATLYDQIVRPGWAAGVTADLEKLLGRAPRSFTGFAADYGDAFRAVP